MRTIALLVLIAVICRAEDAFGTWKVNPARSTSSGNSPIESFMLRIAPHAKGEVFTVDKTKKDGRATTSSTILYLDGKPRDFHEALCSGTQLSRHVGKETVEIIRSCGGGAWIRFIRRLAAPPKELILEITEQLPDGRRHESRLVLEKQAEEN
jgi:hypothetical protein